MRSILPRTQTSPNASGPNARSKCAGVQPSAGTRSASARNTACTRSRSRRSSTANSAGWPSGSVRRHSAMTSSHTSSARSMSAVVDDQRKAPLGAEPREELLEHVVIEPPERAMVDLVVDLLELADAQHAAQEELERAGRVRARRSSPTAARRAAPAAWRGRARPAAPRRAARPRSRAPSTSPTKKRWRCRSTATRCSSRPRRGGSCARDRRQQRRRLGVVRAQPRGAIAAHLEHHARGQLVDGARVARARGIGSRASFTISVLARPQLVDERRAQQRRAVLVAARPRQVRRVGGAERDVERQRRLIDGARRQRQHVAAERAIEGDALVVAEQRILGRPRRHFAVDEPAGEQVREAPPGQPREVAELDRRAAHAAGARPRRRQQLAEEPREARPRQLRAVRSPARAAARGRSASATSSSRIAA